jgi:succinyl-CoA synthetase beta subunit
MNIHEHQGKDIYKRYGVPHPKGIVAFNVAEAKEAAKKIIADTGNEVVVVKAQIHAGGRGKAGGVKVVKGAEAAGEAARELLGKTLVTKQTGPEGKVVQRLLIEQGLKIAREHYLAMLVDRETRRVTIMTSTEGGVDIEEVAEKTPEKIHKVFIDPAVGLMPYQARRLAFAFGFDKQLQKEFVDMLDKLAKLFVAEDCSLLEVNPLIVTGDGHVLALDAKINLEDNASFRHPEWNELRDRSEEEPAETEAKAVGISYIQLDGNIGCLVNGAGLAMSTMDIIKHYGGEPANFLDVGGGATQDQVTKAFRIILTSPSVQGIFVNIFGGIMKCDIIANGVVAAAKELGLKVPVVVRLEGTNVEEGRRILETSGLAITPASTMADGAQKIVAAVKAAGKGA